MHPQAARRVVVGVDGAPRTIAALRWAATEALRRDAELVAVHAWGSLPPRASYAPVGEAVDPTESARRAARLLSAAVRAAPCPVVVLPTAGDHVHTAERRPVGDGMPPTLV